MKMTMQQYFMQPSEKHTVCSYQ